MTTEPELTTEYLEQVAARLAAFNEALTKELGSVQATISDMARLLWIVANREPNGTLKVTEKDLTSSPAFPAVEWDSKELTLRALPDEAGPGGS